MGRVQRDIEIDRPIEQVFAFVADARNDPHWCATVLSCMQRAGEGPAPGARYEARHRPTFFHPTLVRSIVVVEYAPPHRVLWTQEDDNGVFSIAYRLQPTERGTRFTQSDEIAWKIARALAPVAELVFVRRHIGQQMATLKRVLERSPERTMTPCAGSTSDGAVLGQPPPKLMATHGERTQ